MMSSPHGGRCCIRIFLCLCAVALVGEQPFSLPSFAAETADDDQYYVLLLHQLEFTGKAPSDQELHRWGSFWQQRTGAYIALDGQGEAYVLPTARNWERDSANEQPGRLVFRIPAGQPLSGKLCITKPAQDRLFGEANKDTPSRMIPFKITAETKPVDRRRFLLAKLAYYESLKRSGQPGSAWFRHQVRSLQKELKLEKPATENQPPETIRDLPSDDYVWDRTFDLVSGGRALSENLQLDQNLPLSAEDAEKVELDSLTGITVTEMDWEPLVKDLKPKLDPLASLIPADQHAIFFPTFTALLQATDFTDQQGGKLLGFAEPRSESAMSRERYEKQLCLPMSAIARVLGPQVISSVAITGGDLYFRTGTDVAILFESNNPAALRALVESRVMLAAATSKDATPVTGEVAGASYRGVRNADRSVCSYVTTIGQTVVVSNSLAELARLAEVNAGKSPALGELPEYTFFRHRYPRGAEGEVGLAILSDATIRRWCGPKWRIATSRITRAGAVLAEQQAAQLDNLVKESAKPGPLAADFILAQDIETELTTSGVTSSVYGSLAFNTPIQELDLDKVTAREAEFYGRWRDGYQQNWRRYFDPIAVQLKLQAEKVALDVTVMPLIAGTDYKELIDLSAGSTLKPHAGDQHPGSLFHFALSLNWTSELLKRNMNMFEGLAPQVKVSPLSWLGDTVAIYVDEDKFWQELAEAKDIDKFMEENFPRLPLALYVGVSNPLKLTLFLTGLRAMIEQTAPGMTAWTTVEHNGQSYVKISPTAAGRRMLSGDKLELAIYYAPTPTSLVFTLKEEVLKRSLDRQAAAAKAEEEGKEVAATTPAWVGGNLGLQVDGRLVPLLTAVSNSSFQRQMQNLCWENLAILNEWHARYPDRDPVELHAEFWHRLLTCPGGGKYVWNAEWNTMESTVYGHPGEPKTGPLPSALLQGYAFGNFGVTFENDGLRARVEMEREKSAGK